MHNNNNWLNSKKTVVGPFIRIAKPEIVEMVGLAEFDFAVLDLEHGGMVQMNDIYPLILAAQNKGLKLIARTPGNNEIYIKWLLDLGIDGLQIPHIKTANDAQNAVNFAKFSPIGERGLCRFVRSANYSHTEKEKYIQSANENSLIILQIEGLEGVKNIDKICNVSNIDIIFIGPYDLSQSMGLTGQIWHPKVINQIKKIITICQKKKIHTGIFTDTPEGVKYWQNLGINYINYRIDTEMFLNSIKKIKSEIIF